MMNYGDRVSIAQYEMPALFLQEGVVNSTTKVTQTICLQGHNYLVEVSSSNSTLVIDFEITMSLNNREVLNALFYVCWSIAIQKG